MASRVETGTIFINSIDWSDAEFTFGGIKEWGYGRKLGDLGIQAFVNNEARARRHDERAYLTRRGGRGHPEPIHLRKG